MTKLSTRTPRQSFNALHGSLTIEKTNQFVSSSRISSEYLQVTQLSGCANLMRLPVRLYIQHRRGCFSSEGDGVASLVGTLNPSDCFRVFTELSNQVLAWIPN